MSSLATKFCSWISEESYPLGMHQWTLLLPSKPSAPPGKVDTTDPASMGAGEVGDKRHGAVAVQASLLCRRMVRCFSRAQSRSLEAWRLSWSCLPLASAISSLTLLPFQYIAVGTMV